VKSRWIERSFLAYDRREAAAEGASMALVNKVWREAPYVPPGAEPGLISGRPYIENVQNLAVQDIARRRFPFPNGDYPQFKTYVNRPDHTAAVRTGSGDLLFPDIVVMNAATTEVEMLGEVETDRSLRDPDVAEKWKAFTEVGRLYLMVPLSEIDRARKLLKEHGVRPAGLRSWRFNMGQQVAEVLEMPL
jgi:hypothetical protein